MKLYPLTFHPLVHDKIWGGTKLANQYHKAPANTRLGESWEISEVSGNISVVKNGDLQGKNLAELLHLYQANLVGQKVWDKYGETFPLLVKLIDAADKLSVQTHPNDDMAKRIHGEPFGKNEAWYIMEHEPKAELIIGFSQDMDQDKYRQLITQGKCASVLNHVPVVTGDVIPIPAGCLHAIGAGNLIVEIQQSSDITYRFYDWDRLDDQGNPRELHVDLALKAVDFTPPKKIKTDYKTVPNQPQQVAQNPYFTINVLTLTQPFVRKPIDFNSFIIYVCTAGSVDIFDGNTTLTLQAGESCLIPASLPQVTLTPLDNQATLLETYIE